jgi:hypothetical protein
MLEKGRDRGREGGRKRGGEGGERGEGRGVCGRTEQDRTRQDRTRHGRAGHDVVGQDMIGHSTLFGIISRSVMFILGPIFLSSSLILCLRISWVVPCITAKDPWGSGTDASMFLLALFLSWNVRSAPSEIDAIGVLDTISASSSACHCSPTFPDV